MGDLSRYKSFECDMTQVRQFCNLLLSRPDLPADDMCRQALTTAIVVAYARPFTRSNYTRLADEWHDQSDERKQLLHYALLTLRDTLAGHTDPEGKDVEVEYGFGLGRSGGVEVTGKVVTIYPTLTMAQVDEVMSLAIDLRSKLQAKVWQLRNDAYAGEPPLLNATMVESGSEVFELGDPDLQRLATAYRMRRENAKKRRQQQ